MKADILGVKIDNLSMQEVLEKATQFLQSGNQYYIVTPNPEFVIAAQKDRNFRDILNYSDVAIADGIGLVYAARFLGQRLQRVTGVDLFWFLCQLAEQNNCSVYLLGGAEGIARKTAEILKNNMPELLIAGAESGGSLNSKGEFENSNILDNIKNTKPDIIFVALGHVKQEKWIFSNLDKLTSVKIAMGVGGTFDYVSGEVLRAPEIIRSLGFEWLYRLCKEPKRWKRIFNAVIFFPWLVISEKFKNTLRKLLKKILHEKSHN